MRSAPATAPPGAPSPRQTGENFRERVIECLIYGNDRTRISRQRLVRGSDDVRMLICKQALGRGATARIRHETEILRRLRDVPGTPVLVPDQRSDTLLVQDAGGLALSEWIHSSPIPFRQLAGFGSRLAWVLAGVHAAGVLHRDINPSNILVTEVDGDLRPTLVDFDLATTFAHVRPPFSDPGEVLGRLPYLAPEQTGRTGLPVDHRSDLYALGAVLYRLGSGRPPFLDGDPLRLVRDILSRSPEPLVELDARVPAALSRIVARLLAKEPDLRYQSAEGLAHDLALVDSDRNEPILLGARDFPSRLTAPTQLVGREGELRTLTDALAQVSSGRTAAVFVCGAPGVGKSALTAQLHPLVLGRGGWFVSAAADQYHTDTAHSVFVRAMSAACKLLLAEPQSRLESQRERLLGALGLNASLVATILPEFATLLDDGTGQHLADPRQLADAEDATVRLRQAALDVLRVIASPQRPMVMVLDDLQWAGPSPLKMLESLLSAEPIPGLLLVGAYRDHDRPGEQAGESGGSAVDRLIRRRPPIGMPVTQLRLGNLEPADQTTLLAVMLRVPRGQARELAAVLAERTGGNPGDTVELVNALRREGTLSLGADGWQWDAGAIRRYVGSSEVVELLRERIDRLPAHTQELLATVAILGRQTRLDLLALAADTDRETVAGQLLPALEEGLLEIVTGTEVDERESGSPFGADLVRFRNARVQQAAHVRLDEQARVDLNLTLARRLMACDEGRLPAAEQYLAAFQHDPRHLRDAAEQRIVAALFHRVAIGVARLNHHAAEAFLNAAVDLQQALGVAAEEPARVRLDVDRHAVLCGLGRLNEADELYAGIERRCTEPALLASAATVQITSLTNRGRTADAVQLGLSQLAALGLACFPEQRADAVRAGYAQLRSWLADARVAEDLQRAEVTDETARALAALISRTSAAAFFCDRLVLGWLVIQAHQVWVRHGPQEQLVPALCHSNAHVLGITDELTLDSECVKHVLAVGEARRYHAGFARGTFIHSVIMAHWREPLDRVALEVQKARQQLLQVADVPSACFTFYASASALQDCAASLELYLADVEAGLALSLRHGHDKVYRNMVVSRQLVRALQGRTASPGSLTDDDFDEQRYQAAAQQAGPSGMAHFHLERALTAALFGDSAALREHSDAVQPLRPVLGGTYLSVLELVVRALALADRLRDPTTPREQCPTLREQLDVVRAELAGRSRWQSDNFAHLVALVDAERAWAQGDTALALRRFDDGLRLVENVTRPWHHALLAEHAAALHRECGLRRTSRALLAEARAVYAAWGARGKVAQLDEQHPELVTEVDRAGTPPTKTADESSVSVSSTEIDMMAILQASQAISSQTDPTQLSAVLVDHLQSLTGATRVLLVLFDPDADAWLLQPLGDQGTALPVEQAGQRNLLPLTAFRYCQRTREPLLVSNACQDDRFCLDPYLADVERCALMAVPILNAGALRAVLLLENRLSSSAFSADRLDAVQLIAGQLAISLDNALLYRSLEAKVAARTRTLEQATLQLEALSITDQLTQVANRRRFDVVLEAECQRAAATDRALGLLMVDIDHFKEYNDCLGHPAGDACLRSVASALVASFRGSDLVSRYGGEEFAIILPGVTSDGARIAAQRTLGAVNALGLEHPSRGRLTVSIGVATSEALRVVSGDQLVAAADAALYRAKRAGRARVEVF